MADKQTPKVSVAHVTLDTHCMEESIRFMLAVGMEPVFQGPDVSVLELRGGTHLLLFHRADGASQDASFDLMVDDLNATHDHLAQLGYGPSPIVEKSAIGHHTFDIVEPAGARITFFSNHATCKTES